MAIPDPLVAVVAFLLDEGTVSEFVDTRVFGAEIPADLVETISNGSTIEQTVLIKRVGLGRSVGDNSRIKFSRPRFDVFSYGETPHRASILDLACYEALKQMEPHTEGLCRMFDAVLVAGPIDLREEETQWPYSLRTYIVSVAEVAAA